MAAHLPLSSLLSQVLVAFTIEFDNEFERQMPHRTTTSKSAADSRHGPWLVSMVMWSNLMRLVSEKGVTVGEVQRIACTAKLSLTGMERWGYIVVEPNSADSRPKPLQRDWMVRATAQGRRAQQIWRPLSGVIENRWRARFGKDQIDKLREALWALVSQLDVELPEYLPVLGYGFFAEVLPQKQRTSAAHDGGVEPALHLPALLSKVLLAFIVDFERESDLSLAISANVMRLLTERGVRVRDLPHLSGVSKEAIAMSVGFLQKRRYVVIEPDPTAGRAKVVRLTLKGREARDAYRQRLDVIQKRWDTRFGENAISKLRESLERLVGEPTTQQSPLFGALEPYPMDGARRLPNLTRCHTIRWCCTAAGIQTAVSPTV